MRITANKQPTTGGMFVFVDKVTAATAEGKRPATFRTRKLSPPAPMVLHPGGCGRVGRRRTNIRSRAAPAGDGPRLRVAPPPAEHGGIRKDDVVSPAPDDRDRDGRDDDRRPSGWPSRGNGPRHDR